MTTLKALAACTLASLAAAVVGCSHDHEPRTAYNRERDERMPVPSTMQAASRTRSATEQIADARCERESQCGNIGDNKAFSSRQDCLARIRADWKEDLNARECPGGINQHQLDQCLAQVRAEACANPFDTLARITECTSRQICIEQP